MFIRGSWTALDWYDEEPCRKRKGFPSWSSIAWDGPIEWGSGMVKLETNQIRVWEGERGQGSTPISSPQYCFSPHKEKPCRQIMITGYACRVSIAYLPTPGYKYVKYSKVGPSKVPEHTEHFTAIPISADLEALFTTRWSIEPFDLTQIDNLICFSMCESPLRLIVSRIMPEVTFLILAAATGEYRRVGLMSGHHYKNPASICLRE